MPACRQAGLCGLLLLSDGVILLDGDASLERLPLPHEQDDQRSGRDRNEQTNEAKEVRKDEQRQNNEERMESDFSADDAR